MRTESVNFLDIEVTRKLASKDKKYITIATPETIKRLGPSGSFKKKNIALEQMSDVVSGNSNENFFKSSFIFISI